MNKILLWICAALMVGCFGGPKPLADGESRVYHADNHYKSFEEPVEIKTYVLNAPQQTYVGEAFVSIKKILNRVEAYDVFKADKNFEVDWVIKTHFVTDDIFTVQGKYFVDNEEYLVISNNKLNKYYQLLLDKNLNAKGILRYTCSLNALDPLYIIDKDIKFSPKDIKFKKETFRKEEKIKDGMRYELIYTGCIGDNITMVYREYTADDMARPAFSQNLSYSIKQRRIRFQNLSIEIISADNEKIKFKVLSDS